MSDMPALDDAIRAEAGHLVPDGEIVTDWIVVAATRGYDGGGAVLTFTGEQSLPQWVVRGMLTTALRLVDRVEDDDQ